MDTHHSHLILTISLVLTMSSAAHAQDVTASSLAATDLVAMLRDDDVPWNATRAMTKLCVLPESPIKELQQALDSDDWQQRQLAASLLWKLLQPAQHEGDTGDIPEWRRTLNAKPTSRLFEVTIEGFRADALPYDRRTRRYTPVFNAADGLRYLVPHAADAHTILEAGLDSDDRQQRFLCALALGLGSVSDSADKVAPILLPHLRNNDIADDARWATAALYRLGDAVIPLLNDARPTADDQQASLIDLIILDLTDPPESRAEEIARSDLNTITQTTYDPATANPLSYPIHWLRELPRMNDD